mmetsp:Transcript_28605/g.47345  ORF Transcript_28605/g.47345 Transcript_28605/m.47345 type:complete len:239 (+) Transcript_28605:446-1162(+)
MILLDHLWSLEVVDGTHNGTLSNDLNHGRWVQANRLGQGKAFTKGCQHGSHERVDDQLGTSTFSDSRRKVMTGLTHDIQTIVLGLVEQLLRTGTQKDERSIGGRCLATRHGCLQESSSRRHDSVIHAQHVGLCQSSTVDNGFTGSHSCQDTFSGVKDGATRFRSRQHRVGNATGFHDFLGGFLDYDRLVGELFLQCRAFGAGTVPDHKWRGLRTSDSLAQETSSHALSHDSQTDKTHR